MVTAVMRHRLGYFIIYILLAVGIFSLYTCAFKGDVYIGFFWSSDATDRPVTGSDFSTIPNVPADPANIENGKYFLTLPGSFAVTYTSAASHIYTKTITMEAAAAVGGFETTYYNIALSDGDGITVTKEP